MISRSRTLAISQGTGSRKSIGIDEKYYRPTEVQQLLGDATKAKEKLGWEVKTTFQQLIRIMVNADWEKIKKTNIG